jgi:hypothetical protein
MLDLHYQIMKYSLFNSIKLTKVCHLHMQYNVITLLYAMYKHNIKDLANASYVFYTALNQIKHRIQ